MIKISLLLPSRGRPKKFNRLISSINKTTFDLSSVELISIHDNDDESFCEIEFKKCKFKNIQIKSEQSSMGFYNSECLKKSSGESIILINDDVIFKTKNWDKLVNNLALKHKDSIYLGYGNDLFKGSKLPTFPILNRALIELIKDPYPVEYKGAFIDTHLNDLFQIIRKKYQDRFEYLEKFIIEHLHYRTGKSKVDEIYLKRDRFGDDNIFLEKFKTRVDHSNLILESLKSKNRASNITVSVDTITQKIFSIFRIYMLSSNYKFTYAVKQWIYFTLRAIYVFLIVKK
jgi:hypothetical protein